MNSVECQLLLVFLSNQKNEAFKIVFFSSFPKKIFREETSPNFSPFQSLGWFSMETLQIWISAMNMLRKQMQTIMHWFIFVSPYMNLVAFQILAECISFTYAIWEQEAEHLAIKWRGKIWKQGYHKDRTSLKQKVCVCFPRTP